MSKTKREDYEKHTGTKQTKSGTRSMLYFEVFPGPYKYSPFCPSAKDKRSVFRNRAPASVSADAAPELCELDVPTVEKKIVGAGVMVNRWCSWQERK